MKFPYELSEQRISLLSKEDQRIYRFEHSDFFDVSERERCMLEYQKTLLERQGYYIQEIKNDAQFNHLNESQIIEAANELTLYEQREILEQLSDIVESSILSEMLTEDEVLESLQSTIDNMNDIAEHTLNENAGDTIGPDMTYWAKGIGGLFGGLFGLALLLIMKGKTRAAIKMLENSMNKIVETVDDGINKKKGRGIFARIKTRIGKWFNKDWSGENEGEQNTICLRTLQEGFSSTIGWSSMILCKKLGLLPNEWNNAIYSLKSNNYKEGDMAEFDKYIAKPVNELSRLKAEE